MTGNIATPCGFFGKLPCRGDFVERRLDRGFCSAFDTWLQASILASKSQLGEAWLPAYLEAPLWRFAIEAGVCGARTTVGVMMASVDRVGRYYPLTIASHLAIPCPVSDLAVSLDEWFLRVEEQAVAALEDDCSFEGFDAGVSAIGAPVPGSSTRTGKAQSLWWAASPDISALMVNGLPEAERFSGFLQEDSTFFFEKKNQKTFTTWLREHS